MPALDAAFNIRDRDKRVAGSVLAGALAFRLFTPLLPLLLLGLVVLGYSNSHDAGSTTEAAQNLGIKESALNSVAHSARLSGGGSIGVAAFALFALLTASLSATRAIRAVHSIAWGMPLNRFARTVGATLAFIGWMVLLIGLWAAAAWAREDLGFAGVIADLRGDRGLLRRVARDLDAAATPPGCPGGPSSPAPSSSPSGSRSSTW